MTTDDDLLRIIAEALPAAHAAFAQSSLPRTAESPDIWEVSRPLKEAMDAHPEFAKPRSRFFLGKQLLFDNSYQAVNLLQVAVSRGSGAALSWYRAVQAEHHTPMRVVGEVYGLLVDAPHRFRNGVTLVPVNELPDSPNSRALKQRISLGVGLHYPAAVTLDVADVEGEDNSKIGHERFLKIAATLRETIEAFVLADEVAPIVAEVWREFAEPEMEAAEMSRSWMNSQHDGRLPEFPVQITPEMIDWVERYVALRDEVARACRVPIQRLNLARRRNAVGDKAIDGSICLEALLSGDERGELTYRLSLRAALLLGKSLDDRKKKFNQVRDFYR